MRCRRGFLILAFGLVGWSVYRLARRSGVTDAEYKGQLPGDELIPNPMVEWTRGVTVPAPPDRVWPWLAQMGFGRGGWYTSVIFDRLVWRLENLSSEVLLPELGEIKVGDVIPDGPDYSAYFRIEDVSPEEWIVYRSIRHPYRGHPVDPEDASCLEALESELRSNGVYLDFTWSWSLQTTSKDQTRLLVRTRADYSPRQLALTVIPLGIVDFYHVSTMFSGITRRVANANAGRR